MAELAVAETDSAGVTAPTSKLPESAEAVLEPGTPECKQQDVPEAGTADKAKKNRRRRGKKPAAAADKVADENAAPADGMPSAAPVDVAAILKARAAAKKGGRKQSDAQKAALANAKARPQKKSGAKGGRSEGGPRAAKTGKSQNDKCLP